MSTDPGTPSLTTAFRQRTRLLHTQAERSGLVQEMLVGSVTRQGYALLIRNLLPAYEAMELALRSRRDSDMFRPIAQPQVYRAAAIKADLTSLCGASWLGVLPLLDAGRRYAARIETVAQGDGTRLFGHAYARYLGDLNGGQILKRLLTKTLGLGPDSLTFYEFPLIADIERFKSDYRRAIDEAGLHITRPEPVIEEAAVAFEFNIQVSEAVKAAVSQEAGALSDESHHLAPACGRA